MKKIQGKIKIRTYLYWLYGSQDVCIVFVDGLWRIIRDTDACVVDDAGACQWLIEAFEKALKRRKITKKKYIELVKEIKSCRRDLVKDGTPLVVFKGCNVERWVIWHEVGHLLCEDGSEYAAHMWALEEAERRGYTEVYDELINAMDDWIEHRSHACARKRIKRRLRYKKATMRKKRG